MLYFHVDTHFHNRMALIKSFGDQYSKVLTIIAGKNSKVIFNLTDEQITDFIQTAEKFKMNEVSKKLFQ